MIFWAVAGPTPGRASSCSSVAVLRSTGAGGGAPGGGPPPPPPRRPPSTRHVPSRAAGGRYRAAGRAAHGHDHLLAVEQLGGQVDGLQCSLGSGAPGRGKKVGDARAGRQMIDAGSPHRPADVDHDLLRAGKRARRRRRRRRIRRHPEQGLPTGRGGGMRREQVARAEHGDDECQADVDVRLAARDVHDKPPGCSSEEMVPEASAATCRGQPPGCRARVAIDGRAGGQERL
jgi:hypothetical protein